MDVGVRNEFPENKNSKLQTHDYSESFLWSYKCDQGLNLNLVREYHTILVLRSRKMVIES